MPTLAAVSFAASSFVGGALPVRAASTAHVFRFASAEEIQGLNPDLNSQLVVSWLSQMTGAFLFRLDAKNSLIPELATQIPTQQNGGISRDGLTITLHIRKGVKWSDGAPFDSGDVAFTIAAINNPANAVPVRSGFDQIASVQTPDKTTVVVRLKTQYGGIVHTLFASNATYIILPKHVLGDLPSINNAPFNGLPIGVGPFRYKAWKRGEQVELERNPNYWRGMAALDEVIYKIVPDRNTDLVQLQTGDIDMWFPFGGAFLARVAAIPGTYIIRHPGYVINETLFNTSSPPLREAAVRRALRLGIDRRTIREKISHGVGVLQNVVFTEVDPSTPKDIPFTELDVPKANAILDAAGWKRGDDGVRAKNGVRLSIDVASGQGLPDADQQIELIRSTWKELGVELNVQRYQSSIMFGPYSAGGILETGKFGVAFLGQLIPAPFDLTNTFGCKSVPPNGQNYTHFCDPGFDALAVRYGRSYDDATRDRFLSKAAHILDESAVIVPSTGREDIFGLRDSVKNFHPNAATPFDDMMHVDVIP